MTPLALFDAAAARLRVKLQRELAAGMRYGRAELKITVKNGEGVMQEGGVVDTATAEDLHAPLPK